MANLCLENAQFLNETALDAFNFILDEFSNEYNYLQNIDEVSISDSINTAINKLKELWKSFMEWVKDTIRKVKVKLMQLVVKLKHNKNRGENNKSELLLLPAKSKTTEDEEKTLENEERKRRENNKNKHNISNDKVIEANAPDKIITIKFYNSFTKNDNSTTDLLKRMARATHNGFDKLCDKIYYENSDDKRKTILNNLNEYDIFYEILNYFDGSHNNTNYTFDKNKSINENIHNALLGSNKDEIKVIFNNNGGYSIDKIFELYISNLDYCYNYLDSKISNSLKATTETIEEDDDIEDEEKINCITGIQKILKVVKSIIKSLINCNIEGVSMFYKIFYKLDYNNYRRENVTLYKYVKFEEA